MSPLARRLRQLPPYLFVELDRAKRAALAHGQDVIDLGVGDPDQPTLPPIVEHACQAVRDPATHRYPLNRGLRAFRDAIAAWYARRFGVTLDPETEILPLLGSKEGLVHVPLALLNPGDVALIPDPCYPAYRSGVFLAGGQVVNLPLQPANGFFPDVTAIATSAVRRAKLLYLNYPNNPTAAIAEAHQFDAAIRFATRHRLTIISDLAYSELAFEGVRPPSLLQRPGGKRVGMEFHSCSKTFNMTGWRLGWACGNARLIAALAHLKSHVDSGVFSAIQQAGCTALQLDEATIATQCRRYQERRDVLLEGLARLGWQIPKPKATFYVWARVPFGSSRTFARRVLTQAQIVVTPGVGFGPAGEGYVRMALTVSRERLLEAVERFRKVLA